MNSKIAVVIPCYRVTESILNLIESIDKEVSRIYIIDDCCPNETGKLVEKKCADPRVKVIFHSKNTGVGGAVKSGYKQAISEHMDVIVKLDGDGQMNPQLIKNFIAPIINNEADYVKGNRFYNLDTLIKMPKFRLAGNSALGLINKIVSGYWNVLDPTNGYTAIDSGLAKTLPLDKISDRYFFESDMLFRLGTFRAVVYDLPMDAKYGDEKSSMNLWTIFFQFPPKYLSRFFKRIIYTYFLRDFNVGTISIIMSSIFIPFGIYYGLSNWIISIKTGIPASSGTVMLSSLPLILGFQFLLTAIQFDINNQPSKPLKTYYR
jgi:dolichol-phosphate mannosyltransferase